MTPYARLSRSYRALAPDTIARGNRWYPTAQESMQALADETGYTLAQAVAVMSILSPRVMLSTNLRWTAEALRSNGQAKVGRFPNRMMPAVRAVLADPERAEEYVSGPKCGPFFRAILGDPDALVLDVWALRAAGVEGSPSADARRQVEAAYRRLAARVGARVRDLQAALWIHSREGSGIAYQDIV